MIVEIEKELSKKLINSISMVALLIISMIAWVIWYYLNINELIKILLISLSYIIVYIVDKKIKTITRQTEIFKKIQELDNENEKIFSENNPFSEKVLSYPSEDKIKKWKVLKKEKIKPNNQKILVLLEEVLLNIKNEEDKNIILDYKNHLIEYNFFLENKFISEYKCYPKEIKRIIKKYGG